MRETLAFNELNELLTSITHKIIKNLWCFQGEQKLIFRLNSLIFEAKIGDDPLPDPLLIAASF